MVHDVRDTKLDTGGPPTPALLLSVEKLLRRSTGCCEIMPGCTLDGVVALAPGAGWGLVAACCSGDDAVGTA